MTVTMMGRKRAALGVLGVPGLIAVAAASLLLGGAAVAFAQEPAGDRLPTARVALIDANVLYSESLLGKRYAAKAAELEKALESVRQAKETAAAQRSSEISALKAELEKPSGDPSGDKAQEARRKERELQAFIEDGKLEIDQAEERARQQAQALHGEYQREMRPFIEAVAREKGIDFLLDAGLALPLNATFDISREVVARADAAEKAGPPK
jgi:Skp family chaperone for outer membrane proteins